MPESIPTYRFDEHNEAFYYWHKARHDGHLSHAFDVFHVDAHSDMAHLPKLDRSLYWNEAVDGDYLPHYHAITYEELNIANFIIPAVLNGIVRDVYFVSPSWRRYKRQRTRKNVGTAFGEGKIFKHDIEFSDPEQEKIRMAYPDLAEYRYVTTTIDGVPTRRKAIVDIDLDYFACTDSITNGMRYALEITPEQSRNAQQFFMDNPSLKYSDLDIEFKTSGTRHLAVIQFKRVRDTSYIPTESEIRREVDKLIGTLISKHVRPVLITICRSCVSGYCPPAYSVMIEDYLLERLQSTYAAINIES